MGTTSSEAIGPFHPGTFLRVELLEPQQLSQHGLAMATGLPTSRINQIVLGRHSISAETDLRHCRYFGLSHGYFLDAVMYCRASEMKVNTPTLFDLDGDADEEPEPELPTE